MRTNTYLSVLLIASSFATVGSAACTSDDGASENTAAAPLVGVDGSIDQADRNCHVVLRQLERASTGGSGFETNGSNWVWRGQVDVSAAAAAEGLVPRVLYQYGSDPTWWQVTAEPSAAPVTDGFVAYSITLDHDLFGPGLAGTALSNATVHVVPLLALPEGGRLFDHNRYPGDFDNYAINLASNFAVPAAGAVCPAAVTPAPARLVYAADFSEQQIGAITPGSTVRVEYAAARLAQCSSSQGGHATWDVSAHLRFSPSNDDVTASVLTAAPLFTVPPGTTGIAAWFEATNVYGCHAYDSNFGANYAATMQAAPQWIGNAELRISRDTSDPCDGGTALPVGFRFDTWTRQRAAFTNVCVRVYQPGVTDQDNPPGAAVDVTLNWRGAGTTEPFRVVPGAFDRRVGNDARFVVSLRGFDPFAMYHCPDVPVTIGVDGYADAPIEYYLVVNGVEVRPDGGGVFPGMFSDYAPSAPATNPACDL